jgi:hypothetical protein
MKNIRIIIAVLVLIIAAHQTDAQPNPPSDHGLLNDESPAGGGAPIDGGIKFLLVLASVYGAGTLLKIRKQDDPGAIP